MTDSTLFQLNHRYLQGTEEGTRPALPRLPYPQIIMNVDPPAQHAPPPSVAVSTESLSRRTCYQPAPLTSTVEILKAARQLQLRRERNRLHQARHKMKQQKHVADLESSIKALQEEVQQLTLQRQLIHHGVPAASNIWSVAAEFFRLFRHSVRPPAPSSAMVSREYSTQREFLRSTMSNDVTDGAVCGVDALLENWALQSLCYEEIDLQPVRLEQGPRGSLVATTKGTLMINDNTLRYAFPHLIDNARWSELALKMLGQRLALRGSVQFEWDSASARVTSVVCKADILTPLLQLFGSVDDVARVFEKARLTAEGRLVSSDGLQVC